jgi:hypothetical protein
LVVKLVVKLPALNSNWALLHGQSELQIIIKLLVASTTVITDYTEFITAIDFTSTQPLANLVAAAAIFAKLLIIEFSTVRLVVKNFRGYWGLNQKFKFDFF